MLVNQAVERFIASHHLILELISTIGDIFEAVVVAARDNEHEGGPSNNPGLCSVVLATLAKLLEVSGLPLEGLKEFFHLLETSV